MIGTNVLLLNTATIIKAVEYYLNEIHLKEPVKITALTENKNDHQFEVTFTKIIEEDEDS